MGKYWMVRNGVNTRGCWEPCIATTLEEAKDEAFVKLGRVWDEELQIAEGESPYNSVVAVNPKGSLRWVGVPRPIREM